jgi:hypothetical protein
MELPKINPYLLVAHLIMLGFQLYFLNFTIDDAFISYRYAKNLFQEHQFVFNINEPPVEGYSNFLWVMWICIGYLMNIEPIIFSKISGILFSQFSIYVLYKLALLLGKNKNSSTLICIFYACLPNIALWSIGGLETSLFSLFLMIALYFFILYFKNSSKKALIGASLFFSLASLTRHEGLLIFASSVIFLIGIQISRRKFFSPESIILLGLMFLFIGVLYGPYFLWRIVFYGSILPHTFIVKAEPITFIFLLEQLVFYLPLILIFLPILILILMRVKMLRNISQIPYSMLYLGVILITFCSILIILSSWMPGFRFAIPIIPLILLFIPDSINIFYNLAQKYYEDFKLLKFGRYFTISVICVSHFFLIFSFNSYVRLYATGINEINITLGKWINQNTNQSASLAVWDVGAIPFYANIRTIDIYPESLQDKHVFTFPEDADYILDQNISILILNDDYFEYIKIDPRFTANYQLIFNAQLFYVENQLRIDYIYQVYLFNGYYISNVSITNLINSSPRFYI